MNAKSNFTLFIIALISINLMEGREGGREREEEKGGEGRGGRGRGEGEEEPCSTESPGRCRLARSSSLVQWAWSMVVKQILYSCIIEGYKELKSSRRINLREGWEEKWEREGGEGEL